jgi:hypothetical protein
MSLYSINQWVFLDGDAAHFCVDGNKFLNIILVKLVPQGVKLHTNV